MATSHLTADRLQEVLSYDKDSGVFIWKTSGKGRPPKGSRAGHYNKTLGYRTICIDRRPAYEHRLAWLYVHGQWPKNQIDHINGDRADNRICNLREATHAQNTQNKPNSKSATGVRGVYMTTKTGVYRACIGIGGRHITLGLFKSVDEAAQARREAELNLFTHSPPYAPLGESHAPHAQPGETL